MERVEAVTVSSVAEAVSRQLSRQQGCAELSVWSESADSEQIMCSE